MRLTIQTKFWAALLTGPALLAAPIPKLYNTGVDDAGNILAAGALDPHYRLVESADSESPGPEAFTLLPGFPVPPWLAEGPASRWIAPRANQSAAPGMNLPGTYVYETTFDLTGFDPAQARITGRWAVDNGGEDIILNGQSLGLANTGGFGGWTDFEITFGFEAGVNTLQFVMSNAPSDRNPTGLRVEMLGTVELPNEAPSFRTHPVGARVLPGENVTLTVQADGTQPLSYQWKLDGEDIPGATDAMLEIGAITAEQEGTYTVVVTNAAGSRTSNAAEVLVLTPIGTLFNTGVDESRVLTGDGVADSHYKLVQNADNPESQEALTQNTLAFPIVGGPWLLSDPFSDTSAWIGPRFDTSGAAGGDYTYQTTFDLTGLNPATAFVAGQWSTDNLGLDIILNGVSKGLTTGGNFGAYTDFMIDSGFVPGINTLEFKLNNAGAGYTGLRVNNLRGGAREVPAGSAPTIETQPQSITRRLTERVVLSVSASGADPLTFQWTRNGENIQGATSANLVLDPLTMDLAGVYRVVVSNNFGTRTSEPATLTVEGVAELDIAMFSGLQVGGLPGSRVRIEYVEAPGLQNWATLTTLTLATDPTFYLDTTSHTNKTRQYRAVALPPQ